MGSPAPHRIVVDVGHQIDSQSVDDVVRSIAVVHIKIEDSEPSPPSLDAENGCGHQQAVERAESSCAVLPASATLIGE